MNRVCEFVDQDNKLCGANATGSYVGSHGSRLPICDKHRDLLGAIAEVLNIPL